MVQRVLTEACKARCRRELDGVEGWGEPGLQKPAVDSALAGPLKDSELITKDQLRSSSQSVISNKVTTDRSSHLGTQQVPHNRSSTWGASTSLSCVAGRYFIHWLLLYPLLPSVKRWRSGRGSHSCYHSVVWLFGLSEIYSKSFTVSYF